MMNRPFTPSRPDGRSDRQVVFDLAEAAVPDTTFTHDEMIVPGKGYRVIHTSEAVAVALDKKGRAESYLARGLAVLRNARLDELDGAQRVLHEGQLLIMAGLYEATQQSERRHQRSEELIADLMARVEKVEQREQE